jgi:large subunit ribosomal protein L10
MNQETLKAKQELVNEIVAKAKDSQTVIVAEYRGLTVSEIQNLRRALRAEKASMFVYKNSLVERAADELGYSDLKEYLTGPNAIIFSEDVTAGAKVVTKFAKKFPDILKVKGGVVEGKVVDSKTMKEVASIPSKEGLYSMFLSCLQAPIRQFACAVKAVADAK